MSKITIFIPPLPQRSYAYRRGDAQIIHDDSKHAIVIDGGEDALCNEIIKYCKAHGITNITYILSHWHYDHDRGMKLLLDSSIIVDKIYCPPPSDLTKLRDSDARDDYSRASQRIAQAKNLKKTIIYPPADQNTRIKVGSIVCDIWRRSVRPSENVDYQVNNTSLVCYFPELYYMTSGDTINAINSYLANKYGTIRVFKIPHHGNACTTEATNRLAELGAKLCWYNHAEAYGVGIGGDSFSHWGALYCKNKGFVCLRPFYTITMTAADGKLYVEQNGSKWTYDIPYNGKPAACGWLKGTKGMWYQYPDGTWPTGWAFLKTQDGKGEAWHYFDADGWLKYGWLKNNGYWYFLDDKDGHMHTGWLNRYGLFYLEPVSGKNQGHAYMSETAVIDGKTWRFDDMCYAKEVSGSTPIPSGRPSINQNPNFKGYNTSTRNDPIMYIVIHYTGAEGTAKNNIDYFNNGNRGASAHYFVDRSGEIREYCDPVSYYAWHCGGSIESSHHPLHGKCTNSNSIGIEICTHYNGSAWEFTTAAVSAAIVLTKYLMTKFGVSADHVCRHYDVTGKACPRVPGWGAVGGDAEWKKFLAAITTQARPLTDNEKFIEEIGAMARADMAKSGICAAVTVAQAILESGWGKSDLAVKANNIFGMKCSLSGNTWPGSTWDGKSAYNKSTGEYYSGSYTTVKADFRKYGGWGESVADHSAYLAGAKNGSVLRYAGLVGCTDYRKAAQIIKNGGYATSPDYVTKICNIVEQYNLVRFNTNYSAPANTKPATTVTPAPASKVPYLVRVGSGVQIYKAPAGAVTKACPYGVYTIVEERNGYGKLKSGAGWLKLSAVTKV